jgi:hypothetical protein
MATIIISEGIQCKLATKHDVTPAEVHECFANRCGGFLLDTREEHASDPPTRWFVSETDLGKKLKIVFILKDDKIYLRTAYPANADERRIYEKYGK